MNNPYTVRFKMPLSETSAQQFALAVSEALVRLSNVASDTSVVQGESVQGKSGSWAIALYDEVTGLIAFLPGVRFIPVGSNTSDVNVGFELDVSPRIGSGIGGTSQGYMFNFGTVGGSKLAAGLSANNEDTNIPRIDTGFKPKRGATLEFYGSDGDASNTRKGQIRTTLGPGGKLIVTRYVSADTWEVIGGFGPNGEMVCGFKNYWWPGDGVDGTGAPIANPPAPPAVFNVYAQPTSGTTDNPVATISKVGHAVTSKLSLYDGTNTTEVDKITVDPTGVTGEITLTLQQKYFAASAGGVGDTNPTWVLCASTV